MSAVSAVVLPGWLMFRERNPQLPHAEVEQRLQNEVDASSGFTCEAIEGDETVELDGADYLCDATRAEEDAYFVATDEHRITGVQPAG